MNNKLKLNLGCGRIRLDGHIGIDIMPYTDNAGNQCVDLVMNIEKEKLPFPDNSVDEIIADSVLEHLWDLEFALNEMWRVLKPEGILKGTVPTAGTNGAWRDPTHRRFFIRDTFYYFTGVSDCQADRPYKPKYARYGFLPWNEIKIEANGSIKFELSPRKD